MMLFNTCGGFENNLAKHCEGEVTRRAIGFSSYVMTDPKYVRGYDPKKGVKSFKDFMDALKTTGFQASNLASAVDICNDMLQKRNEPLEDDFRNEHRLYNPKTSCTIFLGYTSNMVSCGVREYIRYLVKNKMVDVLVTTAGGIEEDFVKCMAPTTFGDFSLDGGELRSKFLNRIGNLLVSSNNYSQFEDWFIPHLNEMIRHQMETNQVWTPSRFIRYLGMKIDNPDSIYYWAYKNDIPVFCPALTDGAIGDMIYFNSIKNPGLIIDIVEDLRILNNTAKFSKNTGMIILGGGVSKHHVCNANLMRNGANYAVFINTSSEFDGSDSGASPEEAVSWGKIRADAPRVKVTGDASILFPLLVLSSDFAKNDLAE